jgi:hypothetical protein
VSLHRSISNISQADLTIAALIGCPGPVFDTLSVGNALGSGRLGGKLFGVAAGGFNFKAQDHCAERSQP